MPTRTTIDRLCDHVDSDVTISGWLYNKRGSKKLQFLLVRDGSGICQSIVSLADVGEQTFNVAGAISQESAVEVTGRVNADGRAPGGHELHLSSITVLHESPEYPISPKEHGTDFLLKHRHLWLRSRKQHATIRIRGTVKRAIQDYLDNAGYLNVDAPIFTPSACEGTTTLFKVDYFGDEAYLTQSGQLYNEASAMAHGKVYCFGPSFRAEKSKTRRHLTEFWMVEPEAAYADMEDMIQLSEGMICHIVERILEDRQEELKQLERDPAVLEAIQAPFPRISYDEAVASLQQKGHEIAWGGDFGAPDEVALVNGLQRPLVVHRFPTQIKAFYMQPDPEQPEVVLGFDILAPEGHGEIVGGGQRADSLQYLEQQLNTHNLPQEAFEWFLDLRRYGSVPHAGFGLGLERTVAWMCGTHHVRETIPFPRMLHKIYP